jgi:FHA domain-containing protein
MTLTFRAVSLNDQPITQPIIGRMGAQGGSIGRADSNTLSLPDPERRISRRQAEISVSGSGYAIKNVGSANPIIVRDQSLAQGDSAQLRPGDQVRIGGYLLEVTDSDAGDDQTAILGSTPGGDPFDSTFGGRRPPPPTPPSPMGNAGSRPAPAFPPSSPFADLGGPLPAGNPFAELLGNTPPATSPPPRFESAPASNRLPDDFDPFGAPPPAQASPPRVATSPGAGAFDDLIPSAAPASIDDLFGLKPGSARDPLAAFLADAPPANRGQGQAGGPGSLSTDPLAFFGAEKESRPPAVPQSSADQTPELRAAFAPPKPMPSVQPRPGATPREAGAVAAPAPAAIQAAQQSPSPAPVMPAASRGPTPTAAPLASQPEESTVPPGTGWSRDAMDVWNALCEGAGVRVEPPPNTGPAFMRVIGMMLRASVDGTVKLMAMRSATRQELQAQVTVIRPRNNNPLKFAPDGQSALEQILRPAVRGFLPGPAAMTDAMNDLLGHAIGTMAGTRAALEGVLRRFEPQELEAKLADKSVLDSVLPMNRKAKLWELYLQHYGAIRDEAQEDFHALFGRAFLAAYEQQLERLRVEKSTSTK